MRHTKNRSRYSLDTEVAATKVVTKCHLVPYLFFQKNTQSLSKSPIGKDCVIAIDTLA
jgi:hypothetical protein